METIDTECSVCLIPGGGTWIQNDGGVHAYDGFCEPALEKIAKNDTRH